MSNEKNDNMESNGISMENSLYIGNFIITDYSKDRNDILCVFM